MKEKHLKIISAVLLVLLALNTWQLHNVRQQLRDLSISSNNSYNYLSARMSDLEYYISKQYDRIDELLNQQASLFSQTSVDMKLQDGRLAVTMQATPKVLQNSETMLARITIGSKVYEQPADQYGTATLFLELTDLTDSIQPAFVIQSPSGVRQETLPAEAITDYISTSIQSSWQEDFNGDGNAVLNLYLRDLSNQPFSADQIADARCIVVGKDLNISEASAVITAPLAVEPTQQTLPQGDTVAVVKQADSTADTIHYQVDLNDYQQRRDGVQYQVYFVLTTADGITFATLQNPIADFSFEEGGGSAGEGTELLIPLFS